MIGVLGPIVGGFAFHGRRRTVFWLLLPLSLFLSNNIVWFIDGVAVRYAYLSDSTFWYSVVNASAVCDLATGLIGLWLTGYLVCRELPRLYVRRRTAAN
jgi:hypothetical protein